MDHAELFPDTPRFRPLRLLGRGGMGAVFAAEDTRTGTHVALKVTLESGAETLLRFKQEFRTVADLPHPNLVRLLDLFHERRQWFFTMELVDGQDLRKTLIEEQDDPATETSEAGTGEPDDTDAPARPQAAAFGREPACDVEVLSAVLAQVVEGLGHLHRHGITHRDLKPTNVLVGVDGRVRLADFGLASRFDLNRRAGAMATGGTLQYMAPELWQGSAPGPESDRYALGCMMYELLTGRLPYEKPPPWQRRPQVEPPQITDRVDGVPAAIAQVARALISPQPSQRPELDEVRRALRAPERPLSSSRRLSAAVFLGREPERERIAAALSAAEGGQARVTVLAGPSGIGKSSLASWALEEAKKRGFLLLQGRSHERERMPFAVIDQVLDEVLDRLREGGGAVPASMVPHLRALLPMFPALGALDGVGAPEQGVEAGVQRARGLRAFGALIDELQQRSPLVLFVDDLHWTDVDSAGLLAEFLPRVRGRVQVLLALRDDAPGAIRQITETAARSPGGEQLSLRPLAEREVDELLDRLGAGGAARSQAAAAEGNPFLVHLLAESRSGGGGSDLGALLQGRLSALSPEAQRVLRLLSVTDSDAPAPLLRACSGLDAAAFDRGVGELLASRMIRSRPAGDEPLLDVYHDRIRVGVHERLDEAERRSLHAGLAGAFEAAGASVERLLYHYSGAGDEAQRRRYALLAVDEAQRKLAFGRAGQLLVQLLTQEPGLGSAAQWERAGDLLRLSGDVEQAIEPYRRSLVLHERAQRPGDDLLPSRLRISGHLAESLVRSGNIADGSAEWARGLSLLGLPLHRPPPLRGPLLVGLSLKNAAEARRHRRGTRPETPLDRAQIDFFTAQFRTLLPFWPSASGEASLRCEAIAYQVGDQAVLQRVLAFRGVLPVLAGLPTQERLEGAVGFLQAAEELVRSSQSALGQGLVAVGRAMLRIPHDQLGAARSLQSAVEHYEEAGLGQASEACMARGIRMACLILAEQFDEAMAACDPELVRPHPDFVNSAYALWVRTRVHTVRGQIEPAREAVRRLEALLERTPPCSLSAVLGSARWQLAWAEGRFDEALVLGDQVESGITERPHAVSPYRRALWLRRPIEPALSLARRRALGQKRLEQALGWAHESKDLPWFGHASQGHRALGLLELARGRLPEAREALRAALHLSRSEPPYRRFLCLDAARSLALLGPDEEAEAQRLAREGGYVLP